MKNIQFITTLFLIFIISSTTSQAHNQTNKKRNSTSFPYTAIIINSVVDMSSSSPLTESLSVSPGIKKNCNRSHQGLYNELVTCIAEKDDFVKVTFSQIKYTMNQTASTFWAKKSNFIPIKKIKQTIALQSIPQPEYGQQPTIVLTYPWKNFSIGTRFKHAPERDTKHGYAIVHADYIKNKLIHDTIPHDCAMQEIIQDSQSTRDLFVTIINNLVQQVSHSGPHHVIPYVWGGSSFTHPYIDEAFYQDKDGAYQRHGRNNPYTGYDCSEFVMRMAQISGINFPWKTTTVIQNAKRKLTESDQLENGDLIWFKGHIMIVSDINQNEVIEARGYPSNYGRIHKIKLRELFENITTYDDLLSYYYANKSLALKNKEGKFFKKIESFQLLKLIN